ncbi:MAG: hypothetical protein WBH85_16995 [Thermoanaerobaculia bacterium]
MSGRLFVGNLSLHTTEKQLARFFTSAGMAVLVKIPVDRQTGRSRGFGFVEFSSKELAEQALAVFNGRELGGRVLRLNWAREREDRDSRSGIFGGEGGGQRVPGSDHDQPPRVADDLWEVPSLEGVGDYSRRRDAKPGKHRKHGSDRKQARGTRRVIE